MMTGASSHTGLARSAGATSLPRAGAASLAPPGGRGSIQLVRHSDSARNAWLRDSPRSADAGRGAVARRERAGRALAAVRRTVRRAPVRQGSSRGPIVRLAISSRTSEVPRRMPSASSIAPAPGNAPRSFQAFAISSLSHSSLCSHGPVATPCERISRTASRQRTRLDRATSGVAISPAYE